MERENDITEFIYAEYTMQDETDPSNHTLIQYCIFVVKQQSKNKNCATFLQKCLINLSLRMLASLPFFKTRSLNSRESA